MWFCPLLPYYCRFLFFYFLSLLCFKDGPPSLQLLNPIKVLEEPEKPSPDYKRQNRIHCFSGRVGTGCPQDFGVAFEGGEGQFGEDGRKSLEKGKQAIVDGMLKMTSSTRSPPIGLWIIALNMIPPLS